MPTAARRLALQVLADSDRGGQLLAELMARPEVEALSTRDRAFLHELVLGTLRHRGLLDHALAEAADRPLARLEPPVLGLLRLGAYQLLRMRVPARAAVSESVELAREVAPRATGFVNAILRHLVREGPPPLPDPEADALGWLTTAGSLPRWLAERWLARLGPAVAHARAAALLEAPPVVFRINPRVPDAAARLRLAGVVAVPLAVPGALEAREGAAALASLAREGVVYAQDQGSQLVAHLAANGSGAVLDACAAPGGKSTLLGDLGTSVVAGEYSAPRLATLAGLVARWGTGNVLVVGADARRPPFRRPFGGVLLDAPCSGLGTLGRHPDIRWHARKADLAGHAQRQRELLEALAPLVAPEGTLVYAACSIEPEENEQVVGPFLEAHPEFAPAAPPPWAAPFAEGPFLRTRPERDRGDGFFAAPLRRL
ncbi:MAG TPA: transcription antitermination factor NusB [Vicinamibacteria bacterium]|nr:transcription antitermination factor NusB [Vicinamibacteria bacterium]